MTLLPWPPAITQDVRSIDQRQVRERLREVAHEPRPVRVVLLGEQVDIVRDRQQRLEQYSGFICPALEREVIRQLERTREKRRLAVRQAGDFGH